MSSIDNLQSITNTLLSTNSQKSSLFDNVTEQSINTLTSIGESFSDLFSKSQTASTVLETSLSLTTDNVSSSLNTMQDELLSNLLGFNSGVTALAGEQLTDISSVFSLDTIKDSLQSNILGALQANTVLSSAVQTVTEDSDLLTDFISFSFNEDGLGLEDAFDTVNILQHIPVVSSIYSSVTEQENIGTMAKLAGDFLYGGPLGLAFSVLDLAIESYSGTSISDAITEFDYSGFLFEQVGDLDDGVTTAASITNAKTNFYDKNSNIISSRY